MPGHGPRWESNLWNTSPMLCQLRVYPGYTLRITSQASYTPEHMTPFYYIGSFQKTSIPPKYLLSGTVLSVKLTQVGKLGVVLYFNRKNQFTENIKYNP